MRDTVAEMAAKAHEISLEAGSKMAAAMKEVVGAAAGLVAFSIESARDLVQYMVRRGQMTQEEADKLVRAAEEAWMKKHKGKLPPKIAPAPVKAVVGKPPFGHAATRAPTTARKPDSGAKKAASKATSTKRPAKKAAAKSSKKSAPAKKAKAKRPASKKPAPKK